MLKKKRASVAVDAAPPTSKLALVTRQFDTVSEDGEALSGNGLTFWDKEGAAVPYDDAAEILNPAFVISVAGVSYRMQELQHPAFAPGCQLKMVPEPKNPYDGNAVGIWDEKQRAQVGYVPKAEAATLAPRLRRGEDWTALSIWEWRKTTGERCGLRVLLMPTSYANAFHIED